MKAYRVIISGISAAMLTVIPYLYEIDQAGHEPTAISVIIAVLCGLGNGLREVTRYLDRLDGQSGKPSEDV